MTISSIGPASTPPPTVNVGQAQAQPAVSTPVTAGAAQASPAPASSPAQVDPASVAQAVQQVAEAVQAHTNNLVFSLDDDSGKAIVKIIDSQTDEVIRQIPSEEMLALAKAIDSYQESQSLLLKEKA